MATLQEAIASGRPFKRPEWDYWYVLNETKIGLVASTCDKRKGRPTDTITVHQAISTDWEIKPREPRKWEYEAMTSEYKGDRYVYSPFDYPTNIKVKVTIEEIINEEK